MIGNSTPTLFMARPQADRGPSIPAQAPPPLRPDLHSVEGWIARHPVMCVTSALAIGALIGWFIKRR